MTSSLIHSGWYRLLIFVNFTTMVGNNAFGGTTFLILRNDSNFPTAPFGFNYESPINYIWSGEDYVFRGQSAMGLYRHEWGHYGLDKSGIDYMLYVLRGEEYWYLLNYTDIMRPRYRLIAFGNTGTTNTTMVCDCVRNTSTPFTFYEPINEPNSMDPIYFLENQMIQYYQTVKNCSGNKGGIPAGPGTVTTNPPIGSWLHQFLGAGGGNYIEAFSFHVINNLIEILILIIFIGL